MEKLQFQIGDIISRAWGIFKARWTQVFGISSLYIVLSSVAQSLVGALGDTELAGLTMIASLAVQVFSIFLSIGMVKLMLALVRNQPINFAELFSGAKYLLQYLLGSLVVGLITLLGFILLVVPGIMWSIQYMFVLYLIVDEGLDYSTAMQESSKMTNGIRGQLFTFGLALFGLNLLGVLAVFVGLIVTLPVSGLAMYVLYTHLRSQSKLATPTPTAEAMPMAEPPAVTI